MSHEWSHMFFSFSLATSLTVAQYCPNRGILWDQISEPSVIIAKLKAANNWDAPNSFYPHSHKLGNQFSEPCIFIGIQGFQIKAPIVDGLIWCMRTAGRCCSRGGEVSKAQQWRRCCTIQHESWKKLRETSKS